MKPSATPACGVRTKQRHARRPGTSGPSYSLRRIVAASDGSIYVATWVDTYEFVDNGTESLPPGMSVFRLTRRRGR
jgi:hypothetical protein